MSYPVNGPRGPAPIPVNPAHFKLGRQPAKRDSRTLEFSDYVGRNIPALVGGPMGAPAKLPNVPPMAGWSGRVSRWGMMGNDRIGNCVEAGIGHEVLSMTTDVGRPFAPPDAAVIKAYSDLSGYDPATGANDVGTNVLDAMNYWRNVGVAGHRIDAYCSISLFAHKHIMQGVYLLGGVLAGVNLPTSAKAQTGPGKTWDVVTGPDAEPGTWGGHLVLIVDYSPAGVTCVTWGSLQLVTWRWLDVYGEEFFAALSLADWLAGGRTPNGFNANQMLADVKAI